MKRLSVELATELYDRVASTLPWGVKSAIFRQLLEMVIEGVEEKGHEFVGALLSGHLKLTVKSMKDDNE